MKPDKKAISAALIEQMNREELHTREAARFLNINPCYISMAKNENSWDAMGLKVWYRLNDWYVSNGKLSEFVIPEGEEIWQPKAKPVKPEKPAADEHSPESIFEVEAHKKAKLPAEKGHKIVKLVLHKAEMEILKDKIIDLEEKNKRFINALDLLNLKLEDTHKNYDKLAQEQFVLIDETIPVILRRLEQLQKAAAVVSITKEKARKGIVIFQRNYYAK
jgi:hypothetical protein